MSFAYNKTNSISLKWCVDDVQNQLNELKESDWFEKKYGENVKLTHDECMEILNAILFGHDASIGVNWDTIEYYIGEYLDEREDEEDMIKLIKKRRII